MLYKQIMEYTLILVGLIFLFPLSITGSVINDFQGWALSIKSFFGLVFIIIGIVLLESKTSLEERADSAGVDVYSVRLRKEEYEDRMVDPYFFTGPNNYELSLSEFKKGIEKIKDDEDLMQMVREQYVPELRKLLADPSKRNIALKFLNLLCVEEEGLLSPNEKREIRTSFKSWNGKLNQKQSGIIGRYSISFEQGKTHGKFILGSRKVTASLSPSDSRAGKNLSSDLIKMIESHYSQ